MPRPGPRPYECVRRAWHSERHQPMRGSIIQQIFRVVNDTHSPITKKNKEWQEKLPIVVLKAEEIMYSKANSEAEYMDLDTLWDRLNDAINTIIRRDESTETGELLPPCIEAALNLGCIPVRASRSQRHSNPRSYLTPRMQEPVSAPPRVVERTNDKQCPQLSPFWSSNQLNFAGDSTVLSSLLPVSEPSCHLAETSNVAASCRYHLLYENVPRGCSRLMTKETNKQLNLGLVYPLYYGNSYHTEQRHLVSQVPEENSNSVIVGTPISTSVAESSEMNTCQSFLACPDAGTAVMRVPQAELRSAHENPHGLQCDLSLRLGPLTNSCMSMERSLVQETEDVGSSNPRDKTKFSDFSFKRNVDQCFSTVRNNNNSFELHPFKWFSKGNDQNLDPAIRKRKAPSDFPSN